jgi:hypothetical protein
MGFASVQNVESGMLEDRMNSFFLAETCKYLYLLFDPDNAVLHSDAAGDDYIFTTEGHLFPVLRAAQRQFGDGTHFARYPAQRHAHELNQAVVTTAAKSVLLHPWPAAGCVWLVAAECSVNGA